MNAAAQYERPGEALYSRAAVAPDSLSDESRSVDVIASTEAIDSHGTVIRQNWQLDRYRASPVVLYAHDSCELPIGLASNVRIQDGALCATLTFSTEDLNPQAEMVWKNVKAGTLRGVSVGFWPHSVRWETEEDREFVVLDDNELFEISMVPVGSNPETLAQMRARALATRAIEPAEKTSEQPPAAEVQPAPVAQERQPMTESSVTPTILRALGLPPGSSENDGILAASRKHELEVGVVSALGLQSSAEALGAIRGLVAKSKKFDEMAAQLAAVEAERDQQNFDAQIQRAINERKMSNASIEQERKDFLEALGENRGARAVSRLKGFLDTAPVLHMERVLQPRASKQELTLDWNGSAYRDLRPAQRAALSRENPDLYRFMKDEWEAAGRPQATKTSAA